MNRTAIKRLHEEEDGMEAIQIVALIAIAAIVLAFLKNVMWPAIGTWFNQKVEEMVSG